MHWGVIDSHPIYYWHMKHPVASALDKLLLNRTHASMAFMSTGSALLCTPLHKRLFSKNRCWLPYISLVILWTSFSYPSMARCSFMSTHAFKMSIASMLGSQPCIYLLRIQLYSMTIYLCSILNTFSFCNNLKENFNWISKRLLTTLATWQVIYVSIQKHW